MTIRTAFLLAGIVNTGLIAGLMFGWTVSVIPGLRKIGDHTYVSTMQNINRETVNPGFTIPFMIPPLIVGVAAFMQFRAGDSRRGWLLGSAALTYLVGLLGVTIGGNIPLNNALDAFDLTRATEPQLRDRRISYEGPWNRWHYVRTVASVGSFVLCATAAIVAASDS